jgi:hypothetical protein
VSSVIEKIDFQGRSSSGVTIGHLLHHTKEDCASRVLREDIVRLDSI